MKSSLVIACVLGLCAGMLGGGCRRKADVVIYSSVDREVAEPIIRQFERRTGLKVELLVDVEAARTAGFAERLEAERDRPTADVWWGNEPFHTIRLADAGVLAAYKSPAAARIPRQYKDAQHRWTGNGLRVRVMAITTTGEGAVAAGSLASISDLANPALKDRICMANPSAGTTSGHVAALYTLWGERRTEAFFRGLKTNGMALLGGNSYVAEYVGNGQMWAGLTDNDDVSASQKERGKLKAVLPDQGEGQIGTLSIPTTVGLVNKAPHEAAARRLVDYLLSEEVEKALLEAGYARSGVIAAAGTGHIRGMNVDYAEVARNMPTAVELVLRVLQGRGK